MADLFLSYAHGDVDQAATLAELLEANGLTVWWDRRLVPGDKFHALIDKQIEDARAVIVLWSPASVASDWVLGEAQTAHEAGKLVPVKIAACKLPIPYRGVHTPEVFKTASELEGLARMLSEKLGKPSPVGGKAMASQSAVSFSKGSTQSFMQRISSQHQAYADELQAIRNDPSLSWWEKSWRASSIGRKYPWAVVPAALIGLFVAMSFQDASQRGDRDQIVGLVVLVAIGYGIYAYRKRRR